MDCIFCKIIAGEIPSFKLYEDDNFIAILDRFPASPGHALIIPKRHAVDLFELTPAEAAAILPLAQKLGGKIKSILGADGLKIMQNNGSAAGQDVMHYHLHLIPCSASDGLEMPFKPTDPGLDALAEIAKRLQ
ncbi:MAG: HIT family protein [Defluviitaleaceae bacterium]|nr:HIT family protein [Defluviitaleaceae bacterium]